MPTPAPQPAAGLQSARSQHAVSRRRLVPGVVGSWPVRLSVRRALRSECSAFARGLPD
ncbi:hypothetical protein IWW45_006826 [Coemansia sp. RSA 485]|nr:hypothetical protein IWW45_006826 [Coemansia sp. RSA 485]